MFFYLLGLPSKIGNTVEVLDEPAPDVPGQDLAPLLLPFPLALIVRVLSAAGDGMYRVSSVLSSSLKRLKASSKDLVILSATGAETDCSKTIGHSWWKK